MSVAGSAPPGMEAGWGTGSLMTSRAWRPGGDRVCLGVRSNLTCRVTDAAGAAYALRRPPTGGAEHRPRREPGIAVRFRAGTDCGSRPVAGGLLRRPRGRRR
jgi:hypothetical protein